MGFPLHFTGEIRKKFLSLWSAWAIERQNQKMNRKDLKRLTCAVHSSCVGKQKESFQQFRSLGMMDYATDNLEKNQ